jgi:hypothetical protein
VAGKLELPGDLGTLWLRNYYEDTSREGNLSLMDSAGRKRWDAAQVDVLDKWVAVRFENERIIANSWGGYICELDRASGEILSCEFGK